MTDFAHLHLKSGYPIQLQVPDSRGNKQRFFCKYIGCTANQYIVTSKLVTGGQIEDVSAGVTATARLMIGRGICVFPVKILMVQNDPFPVMYLSYPKQVEFKEIRNADRVEVNLPVFVRSVAKQHNATEGRLTDISYSGAKLELKQPVAVIGDEVYISSDFHIETLPHHINVKAKVRTRINPPDKSKSSPLTILGVEFLEQEPERKVVLYAYVSYQLAQSNLPNLR
ncbi:hypothetical protein NBRC116494_08620 [Aurantivibrio plasticivorans]